MQNVLQWVYDLWLALQAKAYLVTEGKGFTLSIPTIFFWAKTEAMPLTDTPFI
jgi:hypothetical protein